MSKGLKRNAAKSKLNSGIKPVTSTLPMGLFLVGCGGGSDGGSTNQSQNQSFGSNSQSLTSFTTPVSTVFSQTYANPVSLSAPSTDQSRAESYLSAFKEKTVLADLANKNSIDGLLIANDTTPRKTEYWKNQSAQDTISFSFFDTDLKLLDQTAYEADPLTREVYENGFHTFSDTQKEAVRNALNEFEKVLDVQFVEVTEQNNEVGTIRFGMSQSALAGDTVAFAQTPGHYWASNGDVWFNSSFKDEDISSGTWFYHVVLHEIGHAMGLSHPHEGGAVTLDSTLDQTNYTLMSYEQPTWAYFGSGADRYFAISESLMVYDIQALQHLYGANSTHNTGNTKYQFDPNTPTSLTIWDAGGEDLLDFSNFSQACDIDINDGSYSTIRYASWNPSENFGIAFNTFIENVSGSQANDTVTGNELNNEIFGNNGNDTLYGQAGNDVFNSSATSRGGVDTMYGGTGDDTYYLLNARDIVIELVSEGTDTVYTQTSYTLPSNVENVIGYGTQGGLSVTGNGLDNVIAGSSGNDTLVGGDGADDFLIYLSMGDDRVTDFNETEGDEVVLAYGLLGYIYEETSTGATYSLSDGSSLELVYELVA